MTLSTMHLANSMIYLTSSISFGFINNFGGPALFSMKKDFPELNSDEYSNSLELFSTLATFFAAIGPFFLHFMIKKMNKRKAVCVWHLLSFVNWMLLFSFHPKRIVLAIVLRSLQGVFYGGFAMVSPTLFCENIPENAFGFLAALNSMGITGSIALIDVLGNFWNWRVLLIVGGIVNLAGAFSIFLAPSNIDVPYHYQNLFQKKHFFSIIKGILVMFFQQLSGVNAIQYNMSELMSECGLSFAPLLQAAICSFSQFLGVMIAMFTLDALGTKAMYIVSSAGSIICMVLYSLNLKIEVGGWYPALFIFLYMLFFGFGMSCIPWFIGILLFPPEVRTMGLSIVTFTCMTFAFIVMYVFPTWNEKLGEFATLLMFCGISVFSVIFGVYWVNDHRNKEDDAVTLI